MSALPTIVSAFAATIAAALAAVNLYLSGRRDTTKWARETLIDLFAQFLDASFAAKNAVKEAIHVAADPSFGTPEQATERVDELRRQALTEEDRMRDLHTRLRLLASPTVVVAAQELRSAVGTYISLLDEPPEVRTEREVEMRRWLWEYRTPFIIAARQTLVLPRAWQRLPSLPPWEGRGR